MTSARALLRTYVESLFLCLAVLEDKSLAQSYQEAESDEDVKRFWHTTASPKNLHARVVALERRAKLPEETIEQGIAWRREEYEVLAQSAHLSYVASALTALPARLDDPSSHGFGVFGLATEHSHRTISYAARTTWYFSRFSFEKILGRSEDDGALLVLDKENELHQRMVIGRDALSRITTKHWNE